MLLCVGTPKPSLYQGMELLVHHCVLCCAYSSVFVAFSEEFLTVATAVACLIGCNTTGNRRQLEVLDYYLTS